MNNIIKTILIILFTANVLYAQKPEKPYWSWKLTNAPISSYLKVYFTVWSGEVATYYRIYAGSKLLTNNIAITDAFNAHKEISITDGLVLGNDEDEVITDLVDISSLNYKTYKLYIEACNKSGCTMSDPKTFEVIAPKVTTSNKEKLHQALAVEQEQKKDKEISAQTTIKPTKTIKYPSQPFIDNIFDEDITDGFSVKWKIYFGEVINKAKLFIGSTLIKQNTYTSNSLEPKYQSGIFEVTKQDLLEHGIQDGLKDIYVETCNSNQCIKSNLSSMNIAIHKKPHNLQNTKINPIIPPSTTDIIKDKGRAKDIEKQKNTLLKLISSQISKSQKKEKEYKNLKDFQEDLQKSGILNTSLPSTPYFTTVKKKDNTFSTNIIKPWGESGTYLKLEYKDETTGYKKTLIVAKMNIDPEDIYKEQKFKLKIIADKAIKEINNTNLYTENINNEITLMMQYNKSSLSHTIIPILCNDEGCTKATKDIKINLQNNKTSLDSFDNSASSEDIIFLNDLITSKTRQTSNTINIEAKKCENISRLKAKNIESYTTYSSESFDNDFYPKNINGCNFTGVFINLTALSYDGRFAFDNQNEISTYNTNLLNIPDSNLYKQDMTLPYYGIFNQFSQFKKEFPHIKIFLLLDLDKYNNIFTNILQKQKLDTLANEISKSLISLNLSGIELKWDFSKKSQNEIDSYLKFLQNLKNKLSTKNKSLFTLINLENKQDNNIKLSQINSITNISDYIVLKSKNYANILKDLQQKNKILLYTSFDVKKYNMLQKNIYAENYIGNIKQSSFKYLFKDHPEWIKQYTSNYQLAYINDGEFMWEFDDKTTICKKSNTIKNMNLHGIVSSEAYYDDGELANYQTKTLITSNCLNK